MFYQFCCAFTLLLLMFAHSFQVTLFARHRSTVQKRKNRKKREKKLPVPSTKPYRQPWIYGVEVGLPIFSLPALWTQNVSQPHYLYSMLGTLETCLYSTRSLGCLNLTVGQGELLPWWALLFWCWLRSGLKLVSCWTHILCYSLFPSLVRFRSWILPVDALEFGLHRNLAE